MKGDLGWAAKLLFGAFGRWRGFLVLLGLVRWEVLGLYLFPLCLSDSESLSTVSGFASASSTSLSESDAASSISVSGPFRMRCLVSTSFE